MNLNSLFRSTIFVAALITGSHSHGASDPLAADPSPVGDVLEQIKAKVQEAVSTEIQGLNIPGLRLELKGFDTNNSGSAYGLAYDYAKSKRNRLDLLTLESDQWHHDWALDFGAKGNLAFKKGGNPTDFQEASVAVRGYSTKTTGTLREELNGLFEGNALMQLSRSAAECTTESIRDSTCASYNTVKNAIEQSLGLLTTIHYGAHIGHETDQEFDATQQTLGAFVAFKLFDARPNAVLGKLNVLDYPFAVLRNVTGRARCEGQALCFQPSGRSFPSLLFSLDKVYPDQQAPRAVAGDDSAYWRANLEVSFFTPIAYYKGTDIYFTASLRHYREIGPSNTVKLAGIDSSTLTTITVGGREGLFISYVEGKLPFGIKRDESIQMGWKFHF